MKLRKSKLLPISQIIEKDSSDLISLCLYLSQCWSEIVGEEVAAYSKPIGIFKNNLRIQLPSSCYVQELNFKKEEILSKINHPQVKTIQFVF